ncbi:MAG TPA: DNA internalization-related competence protein ComEC/Rec2 [Methylomirabilota bacterium]|jgi:competence protein ComEC|nr:DNA internalization-related competence protein ComEC/Rec2 [Methylomirabilota bacterium]
MRWLEAPLVPLAGATALGIATSAWIATPAWSLLCAGALALGLTSLALALGATRLATAGLLLLAVLLGVVRAISDPLPADHIARVAFGPRVSVEGRLAEEPVRWSADRTRLLIDLDGLRDGLDLRTVSGRIQVTLYGETPPVGEGQRVALDLKLSPPRAFKNPGAFDYPAFLRREGILLVGSGRADSLVALTADDPPWPVWVKRWAVSTTAGHLPATSAALLGGLLLGEKTGLPPEASEAFRRAGVYHILAVSGFNVALLASSVFFVLSTLGVPRRVTAVVAGAALVGFALVVGGQASVLRATVMGLLLLGALLLDRESQLMNALALAVLLLLAWRPGDLGEPGFQLSFAATAGIIHLAPPLTAWLIGKRWPGWLATPMAVSLGAQAAVTPVMLVHFNQLSLIGIVANLVVVPMAAVGTTLGMLALLTAAVSAWAADVLFQALWPLLLALRAAVWVAARVPGAMVHLPAPSWAAIAAWCVALALLPYLGSRRWIRATVMVSLALVLGLSIWPWVAPDNGRLRVTFLDVGQGDAILVELPEGQRLLVDGGPGGNQRLDVGERVLAPFLWNRPTQRLDVVALTHPDSDHSGGLRAVLTRFGVREFWENGRWITGTEETLRAVERSGACRRTLVAGQRLWLGSALLTVLNPDGSRPLDDPPPEGQNEESLVLRLDWRGFSLLLTGDLGGPGEERLLADHAPVRALALKVGHHGSRYSSTGAFLDAVEPAVAIISVGARNSFGHPTPEVLGRLEAAGARIYRTDRDGAVILETDGITLSITRWASGTVERLDLDPERGA